MAISRRKKDISRRFAVNHDLPHCVGIVDGTSINFAMRPKIDGEVYWSRKSRYCINLQLVCDDMRNIRYAQAGWSGNVFDSTVFDNSDICLRPEAVFSTGEFFIADASYGIKLDLCTPYKQPAATFPRCTIEHVNGMLKGRFASLKGVRILVTKISDFERMNEWICVCCVMHNMLNYMNDPWDDQDEELNEVTEAELNRKPEENSATQLRVQIQNHLLT